MKRVAPVCDIEACLYWNSAQAEHCERRFVAGFDPGRDILPGGLAAQLGDIAPGECARIEIVPPDGWLPVDSALRLRIPGEGLRRVELQGRRLEARVGRFYPRSLLSGIPGTTRRDRRPFRCLGSDGRYLEVDLNHPLAGHRLHLEIHPLSKDAVPTDPGMPARDILALLAEDGPGMQAGLTQGETDFHSDQAYSRSDESEDARFYQRARLVPHLDETALAQMRRLYAALLRPGMAVLDLMASWDSHLPELPLLEVSGLGMNAEELRHNPRLARHLVQDLNRAPRLPFPDRSFDAVLCSLSVEYLIHPEEIWREVARVLKPAAPFVLSFSERWFPPKAIRIWSELHPFERMGLVLDHFRRSQRFEHLATDSLRGLPRPATDKYAGLTPWSDPLYLVWGRRTAMTRPPL